MSADPREIPFAEAERLLGRRVDHRRKYALIDNGVCQMGSHTGPCSGCNEGYEYGGDPDRGSGCSECGYTGKVRSKYWLPVDAAQYERMEATA